MEKYISKVNKFALKYYILNYYPSLLVFIKEVGKYNHANIIYDTSSCSSHYCNRERYKDYCTKLKVPQYYFYKSFDGRSSRYGNDIVLKRVFNNIMYFQNKGETKGLKVKYDDLFNRIIANDTFKQLVTFKNTRDLIKYLDVHGKRLLKEVKEEHEAKLL